MSGLHAPMNDADGTRDDGLLAAPRPIALDAAESEPETGAQAAPRLWGGHTALSALVAVAILVALAMMVDLPAVWQEIKSCDKTLAFVGLLCHYSTYQLRGVRWRRSIRHLHGAKSSWRFGLLVFFYNFVDNVVPAKLGDVYGAHLARINLGVTRSAALGSIVFVRMIDAWIVLVLAGLASWLVFAEELPDSVVWTLTLGGVIAAAATLVMLTFAILGKVSPERLPESVQRRIQAFQSGMWPRRREWATITALTIAIWALEAAWMMFLLRAFGITVTPEQLLFVTMIPLLATAFPLTPSGAGVVELSLYGCLRALGVGDTIAVSITVLNRLIDFWLHILLGVLTWAMRAQLGLRTWREVPLDNDAAANPPEHAG